MFPHKTVDIIIQPSDDTDYILANPAYTKEMQDGIAEYEMKNETILMKPGDLL